jgi:hypothetical protein
MIFSHGICPITILKCSVEFYKKIRNWFDLVWIQYAKSMKEIENRKRKRRKPNKNLKWTRGTLRPSMKN